MDKCRTDGLKDPIKFRRELLKVTTESQARRTLMQLSAACKWGILGGAENFWESHAENLTTLENSIRVSKVSRLRFEAQAGGGLARGNRLSRGSIKR